MPVVHPCSREDCEVLTMGEFCLLHEGEAVRASRSCSEGAPERDVRLARSLRSFGLGLAVPINAATRQIIAALMTEGRFRRAYLGVALGARPLPPRFARELGRQGCVEVVEIVEDEPAARAGLRVGDLIVALDETAVEDVPTLQRLMVADLIDAPVKITVARDGALVEFALIAAELVSQSAPGHTRRRQAPWFRLRPARLRAGTRL